VCVFLNKITIIEDACALMDDKDKPCQQLCLYDNETKKMECACKEGFELSDDRTTCSGGYRTVDIWSINRDLCLINVKTKTSLHSIG
jgi:hypothetical protein